MDRPAPSDLLADPEDEEESVVGARPQQHHDRRTGVRSETCTPRWVDAAMSGSAAMRATPEGSRATNGASRARKVRSSRTRMNRTDRISVSVWVFDCWVCWSTARPRRPVRCTASPAGAPEVVKRGTDVGHRVGGRLVGRPRGHVERDHGLAGPSVGDTPWSLTAITRGTERSLLDPVERGVVGRRSGRRDVGGGHQGRLGGRGDWNGAARRAARTLGRRGGGTANCWTSRRWRSRGGRRIRATVTDDPSRRSRASGSGR